jgi:hypothetical protein
MNSCVNGYLLGSMAVMWALDLVELAGVGGGKVQ